MTSDELYDFAKSVSSREDFIKFIEYLNDDHGHRKGQWENRSLGDFLSGLSGFARDMAGYYKNSGETVDVDTISWRMAAQMLLAATVYGN